MKRRPTYIDFAAANSAELSRKTAIHEAGHAAAIYLGNQQKQLPPVFFQLFVNAIKDGLESTACLCMSYNRCNHCVTKIEGGRLIHTLPLSVEEAVSDFSLSQRQAYHLAFEADIINLLAGPLAEAHYLALRDDEPFTPRLVNLNALHYYGGASDLETIYEYLECLPASAEQRELKLAELFLTAFNFVTDYSHWQAITALANHILTERKSVFGCEEIIDVLDAHCFTARKSAWC